jgi:hypothetical protein
MSQTAKNNKMEGIQHHVARITLRFIRATFGIF